MRLIGVAERCIEAVCKRVTSRVALGKPLAEQGVMMEQSAHSRMELEQARLLVSKAAHMIDTEGVKEAHAESAMISDRHDQGGGAQYGS